MKYSPMITIALAAGLGACAHGQPTVAAARPAPARPEASATTTASAKPTLASCRVDLDCPTSQLCSAGACVEISAALAECNDLRVHFDLDKADLHPDDEKVLDRAARCILAERGVKMVVTGNADERGTEEYNLALGDRRARTVAMYLEHLGVSSDQLRTISYGKDHPLCTTHDEVCWAENRRSAIKPDTTAAAR